MNDPYQVLGLSPGATKEEIKKAYRAKAKMYHPDLHPDDAEAAAKMNEVNEAYDMLQNPEKYEAKRAHEERNRQARQQAQNAYSGYYQGNPYQGYNRGQSSNGGGSYNQYGSGYYQQNQQGNRYQGANGWYSDFGGFDFDDLFGYGFSQQYDTTPHPQQGDSPQLARAITFVNQGQYQEALDILAAMTSVYRNDRWYYVSALAFRGIGDPVRAQDQIQRAMQMNQQNRIYRQLYRNFVQESQTQSMYEREGRRTSYSPFTFFTRIIMFFIIMRLIMTFLGMLMYGLPMG